MYITKEEAIVRSIIILEKEPNYEVLHWRPISEAKKDGTWYLLYASPGMCLGRYKAFFSEDLHGWFSDDDCADAFTPTHFAEYRKGPKP